MTVHLSMLRPEALVAAMQLTGALSLMLLGAMALFAGLRVLPVGASRAGCGSGTRRGSADGLGGVGRAESREVLAVLHADAMQSRLPRPPTDALRCGDARSGGSPGPRTASGLRRFVARC